MTKEADKVIGDLGMSTDDVSALFASFIASDPHRAAELAYVLALIHLREGSMFSARHYAQQARTLILIGGDPATHEDCAAKYHMVAGVPLPELIHYKVLDNRLKHLKL